jgi:protein-S-isoprenylcysteine O-methyltransferase Ste14
MNDNRSIVFFLVMAIYGAVVDRRYLRAGGARSTLRGKFYFGIAVALYFVFILVNGGWFRQAPTPEAMGAALPDLFVRLFALWEFARWRTRSRHPLIAPRKT